MRILTSLMLLLTGGIAIGQKVIANEIAQLQSSGQQLHEASILGFTSNEVQNRAFNLDGLSKGAIPVSYTHLRAHETVLDIVCRLLLEKKTPPPPPHTPSP